MENAVILSTFGQLAEGVKAAAGLPELRPIIYFLERFSTLITVSGIKSARRPELGKRIDSLQLIAKQLNDLFFQGEVDHRHRAGAH